MAIHSQEVSEVREGFAGPFTKPALHLRNPPTCKAQLCIHTTKGRRVEAAQLLPAETQHPQGGTSTWKLRPLVSLNWCSGKPPHFLHTRKEKKPNSALAFKEHSFFNSGRSEAEGQQRPADVSPIPPPNITPNSPFQNPESFPSEQTRCHIGLVW